jgi:predicted enzyme related to lactoylglutathione lyase
LAKPSVVRFEITGRDSSALRRFYGDLFDWDITEGAKGSGFGVVHATKHGISGVIGPDHSGGSGHVSVYVEVDDLAGYLSKAERLGGKIVVPPTEIREFGLAFAYFADPEGHVVGLSKGVIQ